jgi:hypothetical protein
MLEGLPLQHTETQYSPLQLQESPHAPIKEWELHPLIEGRKKVICTTARTLQVVTLPIHPSLRNTARAPGEKPQNPTTGAQGIKTLTQNSSRCINLNAE